MTGGASGLLVCALGVIFSGTTSGATSGTSKILVFLEFMNSESMCYNNCEEYKTVYFLLNRAVGINTFSRWGLWFFGHSHGHFLFRDNFFRCLRNFEDISMV